MIIHSKLNDNQIALVQKSIESLYKIQDRETLINSIVNEGAYLIGGGKVYLLIYDQFAKDYIPYMNGKADGNATRQLIKMIEKVGLHKGKYNTCKEMNNYWFFPYQENSEISGVLAVYPSSGSLSEQTIHMLKIFMESVPILLENSRLYLLMTRKTKSLTLMSQLHQLVSRYSFQEILAEIVGKIGEILESEMAGVMLYDPAENELCLQKPAFGIWDNSIIEQYRVSLDETSNAKNVFMTGIPSITNHAVNNAGYNQKMVQLFRARSIVTVPLSVDDKRIGVIHAINKKDNKYFTQMDVESLLEIGQQLGTILQSALQLPQELSKKKIGLKLNSTYPIN